METRKVGKAMLFSVICVAVVFGAGYLILRLTGVVDPNACISEEMMTIPDLSGTQVEVVYTNCDTFAKEEWISVYFSRTDASSWFSKRWRHRELVFRYDPARPDTPLPSIKRISESKILISVPEISSVIDQSREWEKISIAYEIGKVDYPASD